MAIDSMVVSTLVAAMTSLATEYGKGLASESAKSTWNKVKTLLDWSGDPSPSQIPGLVADAVESRPELATELAATLRNAGLEPITHLVSKLVISDDGKVVIAQTINANEFHF